MTKKTSKKPKKKAANSPEKPRREGELVQVRGALIGVVTAAELGEIVDLQDQRLRELAAAGMPKASRGKYPLRDAVRFYVASLRRRGESPADGKPSKADTERDLLALKLKKAQGEVFDRREVVDTMSGAYGRLGAAHEQLATRISRELNLSTDDAKMVRDMTDEMRRTFVSDMGEFIEVVEPDAGSSTAAA